MVKKEEATHLSGDVVCDSATEAHADADGATAAVEGSETRKRLKVTALEQVSLLQSSAVAKFIHSSINNCCSFVEAKCMPDVFM